VHRCTRPDIDYAVHRHWLHAIMEECGLFESNVARLHIDNQSAIEQVQSESSSSKTKYVDIRLQFSKYHVKNGKLTLEYIRSELQVADGLTTLPAHKVEKISRLSTNQETRVWPSGRSQPSMRLSNLKPKHQVLRPKFRLKLEPKQAK
jgi:hypothetical protein